MKRMIVFPIVVLLIFCSCGEQTAEAGLDKSSFFTKFTAEYDGLTAKGTLSQAPDGGYTVDLTAPESLNGLTATLKNDKITLKMFGLEKQLDTSALPESSVILQITQAIDKFTEQSCPITKVENGYTLTDGDFELLTDNELLPQKLTVHGKNEAVVTFENGRK